MKLNRKLVLILALVLSLAMATGSTLAFLTDRDTEVNVFTVGNVDIELKEDFEQDSELIPGVDIEKKPTITNVGPNDAWVWATIAIPSALDNEDASKNVVHFNYDKETVGEGKWTWQDTEGDWMVEEEVEYDGVKYNVYTVLYQTALKKGETTPPVMTKVYMDDHVDIAPDGQLYHVEAGNADKLEWNINTDGNPKIYVSAYAMQTDEFEDVYAAYEAYTAQWDEDSTKVDADDYEWGENDGVTDSGIPEVVTTVAELKAALGEGKNIILADDLDLTGTDLQQMDATVGPTSQSMFSLIGDKNVTINLNGKTITADTTGGTNVWTIFYAGQNANLTVKNGRIEFNSKGRPAGTAAFTTFGSNSVITINDVEVEQIGEGGVTQMIYAHGAPKDLGKIYVEGGTYIQKKPTSATNPFFEQGSYNTNIIVSGGTYKVYHDVNLEQYMTLADGYRLEHIKTDDDGAKWYKVVAE